MTPTLKLINKKSGSLTHEHTVYDNETGEIISYSEYSGTQNGKDWWIVYRETLKILASGNISNSAIRVYLHLLAYASWDGSITTTQIAIAKDIGLTRQSVSTAINELYKLDLIRIGEKFGVRVYAINPIFATLGKDKNKRIKIFQSYRSSEKSEEKVVPFSDVIELPSDDLSDNEPPEDNPPTDADQN